MGRGHGRHGHDGGHRRLTVIVQNTTNIINNGTIVNGNVNVSVGGTTQPQPQPQPPKPLDPPQPLPPKPLEPSQPQPQGQPPKTADPVIPKDPKPVDPVVPNNPNVVQKDIKHDVFYLVDVYLAGQGPKAPGDALKPGVKVVRREVHYYPKEDLASRNMRDELLPGRRFQLPDAFEKWEGRMFTLQGVPTPIHIGVADGSDAIKSELLIREGSAGIPKPVGYAGVYVLPDQKGLDVGTKPVVPTSGAMLPIYRDEKKIIVEKTKASGTIPAMDFIVNYYVTGAPPLVIMVPPLATAPPVTATGGVKTSSRMASNTADNLLANEQPLSVTSTDPQGEGDFAIVSGNNTFSLEATNTTDDLPEPEETYDQLMDNAPDENEAVNGRQWGGMLLFDAVLAENGLQGASFEIPAQPSPDEGEPTQDEGANTTFVAALDANDLPVQNPSSDQPVINGDGGAPAPAVNSGAPAPVTAQPDPPIVNAQPAPTGVPGGTVDTASND